MKKNVCGKKFLSSRLRDFFTNLSTKIEIRSSRHIYTNSLRYDFYLSIFSIDPLRIVNQMSAACQQIFFDLCIGETMSIMNISIVKCLT